MRNLIVIIALLIASASFAQSKKLWLQQADELFGKKDYASALVYYKKVLDDSSALRELVLPYETQMVNLNSGTFKKPAKQTTKIEPKTKILNKYHHVIHRIAHCYKQIKDYDNAVPSFRKSIDLGSYPDDEYYFAKVLMSKKLYNDALNTYESYMGSKPTNDSLLNRSQHEIASCYYALDSINNTHKQIVVRMMDTAVFNKGTASFAPVYWGSNTKLIFTSARKGGVLTNPEKQSLEESEYLCDLYWTEQRDGVWQKPHNFGRPLNSGFHDGAGAMDADEIMYFTRWSDFNRNESAIHMARGKDNHFFEAQKLDQTINLPNYKSAHPYVTFDGTKMYFSSNIPGGLGGMDIWYTTLDENGMPGPVKNCGAPINTPGDEVTPFFHVSSNTLFYSSNGHTGLGGLDVFKSHLDPDNGTYAIPVNVGQPVNSSKDDAYYILDRVQHQGYFSSDRQDCVGGHCYDIYEFDNEKIEFDLSGYVYDFETSEPIPGALVTLKDVHGEAEPIYVVADDKGFYSTPLDPDREYFMKAQKLRYMAAMANLATLGLTESKHFEQDFYLTKLPEGEVVIEGVEYDLNKTNLRPKSKEVLNKVYDLMHTNENLVIELNAHTDTRGSNEANMKLSQGRAQSCVDYLISKGIAKERLIAKGYGETKPLVSDAEIAAMGSNDEKEIGHQKNRRTAFTIIGESPIHIIVKEVDHSKDKK